MGSARTLELEDVADHRRDRCVLGQHDPIPVALPLALQDLRPPPVSRVRVTNQPHSTFVTAAGMLARSVLRIEGDRNPSGQEGL